MKIENIINETPLPDTWDKSIFNNDNSFVDIIRYAVERSEKIGAGSSRVAFEVEYQGRPTILKIAKNKKGLIQNGIEVKLFSDESIKRGNITIPLIDYDEENSPPLWVHVEKAEELNIENFRKFFGVKTSSELFNYIAHSLGLRYRSSFDNEHYDNLSYEFPILRTLSVLVSRYNIHLGDVVAKHNWGMYKGEPVIIDLGLTNEAYKLHYM